jgi:hypothetical protein
MREPPDKPIKRATGPHQTRAALAECRALLANRHLSPEFKAGLTARIQQLEDEIRQAGKTPPLRPKG